MPIRNDADELQSPEQLAAWLQVPVATIYAGTTAVEDRP